MANLPGQIVDNSSQVLEAFKKQVENGLAAIGLKAEKHAKANAPVDTGRLRNSITFATAKTHDAGSSSYKGIEGKGGTANPADWALRGSPEQHSVYIGTNVEYAPEIEEQDMYHRSGRAHFLRDAASTHSDEYKSTMETALKT